MSDLKSDPKSKHRTVTPAQSIEYAGEPPAALMTKSEITEYQRRLADTSGANTAKALVQAVTPTFAPTTPIPAEMADFITYADEASAMAALEDADYVAPVFLKLVAGTTLTAIYEGRGTMTLERVNRLNEVEQVEVNTYSFSRGKSRGWLIGAYELDRMMAEIPANGTRLVTIWRGATEQIEGQKNVTRYRVVAKRVKDDPPAPAQLPIVVEAAAS